MKITAVHYEGDTSSLVMGRHHDFRGTEGTAFHAANVVAVIYISVAPLFRQP